jgi:RimJ/RimL family protein N-acetyltransferase
MALVSERLVLDAPRESDISTLFELCQDPAIQRWVPIPSPYSRADAEFFVRSYVPHGELSRTYATWVIRSAEGAPLMGSIELRIDATPGSASLGCWLGADARGHGTMTAALNSVIDHAFAADGLGLEQIRWECLNGNAPSARLAKRLGFGFDADSERMLAFRNEMRPGWLAVLRPDDRKVKSGWPEDLDVDQ